jgi:hypothetical protein
LGPPPRYYGSKPGKIVKSIAFDGIHSWRELQRSTGFTERELNYHLATLFTDKVLSKRNREYYLDPKLVADYRAYYNPTPVKQVPKPIPHETRIDETTKFTQEKHVERSQPIVIRPQIYIAVIIGFAIVVGSIYANNSHGFFPNPFPQDSRSETLPETRARAW